MPENQTLTRLQQNEILGLLTRAGLDPSTFDWQQEYASVSYYDSAKQAVVSKLVHKPTEFFFRFTYREGKHFAEFSPGPTVRYTKKFPRSWDLQKEYVFKWAKTLRQELKAPDLWAEISKETELAKVAASTKSEEFTPREQLLLAESLDRIEAHVQATHAVVKEDREWFKSQFDDLKEAARKNSKAPWVRMFFGTILGLVARQIVPVGDINDLLVVGLGLPLELPPVTPPG